MCGECIEVKKREWVVHGCVGGSNVWMDGCMGGWLVGV